MKAIVYSKKGTPHKLILREIEKPVPGDNEVLIRINAVSLNAADYRSMKMGMIPEKKIFGADIAGVIESVGKNITLFKPGDEVMGDLEFLASLLANSTIKPVIDRQYPLEKTAEAMEYMAMGHASGKVVISVEKS